MTTMNISVPDDLKEFVDQQIQAGYSSASEYVRELIRNAQKEAARKRQEELLLEGLNSGPATRFTDEDWQALHRAAEERLAKQANSKNDR